MPKATPYLFFHGNCEEALTAYARIFDSPPPTIMRGADAPDSANMPAGSDKLVMHADLKVGSGSIFASDDFSGDTPAMAGCNVHVGFASFDKAKAAFEKLAKGGEVRMPFAPTFWSPGFGALSDRFGTRWMIDVNPQT